MKYLDIFVITNAYKMGIKSLVLLLILPLIAFNQTTDTTKTKKVAIGLTYSPDYCYRLLRTDRSSSDQVFIDIGNANEVPKFGFTTGINVAVKVSRRITLEAAVLYSDKGEQTKELSLYFIKGNGQFDPSPALPTAVTFIYQYNYIDVPIKANYYLRERKLKLYLTAGISPNIFINQKTIAHIKYGDGHKRTTTSTRVDKFKAVNLTALLGFGISYDLTRNLYLKIEPICRSSITSIINAPINTYLYSVGLNTGIYYKL